MSRGFRLYPSAKKSPTYSWAKSIGIGATPLEEVLFVGSRWRSKSMNAQDRCALINHLRTVFNTASMAGRFGNAID